MNALYRAFGRLAARSPLRRAVAARPGGRWLTLEDLRVRAERLSRDLLAAGMKRGRICAIATGNGPLFPVAALAVWSLGGVALPIEETIAAAEAARLHDAMGAFLEIRATRGRPRVSATGIARPGRLPGTAVIRLTSGSTGAPRGALVTAAQAAADGRAIIRKMGIRPGDLNVSALPLSHSYGFDNVILPLVLQGTPALLLDRPLPSLLLRALASRRAMVLPTVPYVLDLLARHPDPAPRHGGLRLCVSAGAPLPPATARAFEARFGVPVRTFYGASEAGGITFDDGVTAAGGDGRVGTPLPGVRIRIDRRGLPGLPAGEGRVVVEGPAVASRYLGDRSADLSARRFRTSDLGRLDAGGTLHLTGRLSSLVNVSGRKINPAEIERALRDLKGIEDAAVIGVKDPLRGERVEAWVVAGPAGSPGAIREALASRLSAHKLPRVIHIVTAIPRTERGKLDRDGLVSASRRRPTERARRSRPPTSPS